jgi:LuxR family transcriptional regulator, quorum-sensing system regulator SolR
MMSWLTQVAHEGMSRLTLSQLMPEATITLTACEIEVLKWIAVGKSSYEVGMIMNISERTVNFHINNSMAKLGIYNKIVAVARPIILGLL